MTDDIRPPTARELRRQALEYVRQAVATGQAEPVNAAIGLLHAASADRALRDLVTEDMGAALMARFDIIGDHHSLEGALTAFRSALDLTPADPRRLSNLGLALIRCFELTDETGTLSEAVHLLRQAVSLVPLGDPRRPSYLSNLGLALVRLAERSGASEPADEAASVHAIAVPLVTDPARKAATLANLGAALMVSYRLGGGAAGLQAAVDAYQDAVRTVPADHSYARGCLAGLGDALATAASARGDTAMSVEAMATLRAAVGDLREDDPDGPLFLNQLAEALRRSYTLTGDARALAESIVARRTALARTPQGHPGRLHYQANLALSLRSRFESAGDPADLHEAREILREVVAAAPADHPDRAKWQADVAHILHRLGAEEQDQARLAEAAALLRGAFAETGPGHHDEVMHRVNLGGVLDTAIEMKWQPELYEEAIQTLRSGLAAGKRGMPGAAELFLNLGRAHAARFLADEAPEAHRAAATAFSQAMTTETAPARTRAHAAQHLAVLCTRAGDTVAAADAYGSALELLDLVAWRGLARDDQERALADFPGLGPAAAASAIELGDPDRALSLLEQGRGVLLSQVLELRADHRLLHEAEPALAAELHLVHDAMEASAREEQADTDRPPGDALLARQRLALRRSELLKAIRVRPGLTRFLLPPDAAALRSALPQGAVVALNVAGTRCDALITTPAATTVVPLPGLVLAEAAERASLFLAAVNANAWGTNDVVLDVLAWLWDVAVEPVLHALGDAAEPQRIWWMPTGALGFLPIHAAGHHRRRDGNRRCALHRALSSYTPNLRVLSRAFRLQSAPGRMLVIGADPDPRSLTEAEAETVLVAASQPGQVIRLLGPAASKQAVLDHLPGCSLIHVAGHAITDARNPSESRLNLFDDALRVREITTVRAGKAELAYLSACETAVGGVRVPDEAIHICTAFQLAGFRNVIATLWRVPGRAARDTAATVYSELGRHRPSQAVNLASQRLRESYRSNPYEWAAFIHSGSD